MGVILSTVSAVQTALTGKRVALFAATFNPPTLAHEAIVAYLVAAKAANRTEAFLYEAIYIHVTENSPTGHYKSDTATYDMRYDMAKTAFGNKDRVVLSTVPPVEMVSSLMSLSDLHVTHVLGADSLVWMHHLQSQREAVFFQGVSEDLPVATVRDPLTGCVYPFSGRSVYQIRTEGLLVVNRGGGNIPKTFLGVPTQVLDLSSVVGADVSSTQIRQWMREGKVSQAQAMVASGLRATLGKYTFV